MRCEILFESFAGVSVGGVERNICGVMDKVLTKASTSAGQSASDLLRTRDELIVSELAISCRFLPPPESSPTKV